MQEWTLLLRVKENARTVRSNFEGYHLGNINLLKLLMKRCVKSPHIPHVTVTRLPGT